MRRIFFKSNAKLVKFQSTHPYGVRQILVRDRAWNLLFQSTHPYGVRLGVTIVDYKAEFISIHAPVWGATLAFWDYDMLHEISIHAPVWGATQKLFLVKACLIDFNPRTRMGCDLAGRDLIPTHNTISIHAPVWGATYTSKISRTSKVISIHAPVWGATAIVKLRAEHSRYFNPRTRMGCDILINSSLL